MRFITIILCGLIAFAALADEPAKPRDCPACDLQLTGWTFGGLFGIGTFSADSDSPMVAEAMGIDELPSFAFRGGGGFYLYPGGKYRLGLLGGYTFSGAGDGDKFLRTDAFWGVMAADLVRTTGAMNLTGGIGIGGGMTRISASELGDAGEVSETTPMFTLSPRFGFEFPMGEIGAISLELTYLWFFGKDAVAEWETGDADNPTRQSRLSPIEIGGPTVSIGLQFGKLVRIQDEEHRGD